MSQASTILIALLLLTVLLAGCHAPDDGGGPGDGDGDGDGGGDGTTPSAVESVRISKAPPAQLGSGDNVTVCWVVEGEGTIPHTAVHWDNESHDGESNVTFQAYDMGLMFPDNSTSQSMDGYDVPNEFCTSFEMPDEPVYLIAHAFGADDGPPGVISDEHTILTL